MQNIGATAGSSNGLALFLKALAEDGRAVIAPDPLNNDRPEALGELRRIDQAARDELAMVTPKFSPEAALWAARLTYHLCQFTVCRDIGEEQINAALGVSCPETRSPEVDWSVDLTLRHLPRLFQMARHLSQTDPLVRGIREIAAAWPLSSVGIPGVATSQIESFIEHPVLRRLYTDRILATEDTSRIENFRVDSMLRADLGIHHEIAPALAAKLYPIK